MKKDYTHICIVLDASGSMGSIESDIKGSFNTFLAQQKESEGKTMFDLFQFSDEVTHLVKSADLSQYSGNLMDQYSCSGCTALYDAVCIAIDSMGKTFAAMPEEERPEKVIFTIVTDGHENASRKFSLKDVKERIDRQTKEYSWEFVYLAANQDEFEASRISRSMGVDFSRSTMDAADLSCMTNCILTNVTTRMRKKRNNAPGK